MIRSFRDHATADVFANRQTRVARQLGRGPAWAVARRKLLYLRDVDQLSDLRAPPANRLEALKGDRQGQHSIRINDQFRLCFRWVDGGAEDVEIVDYH